MWKKIQNLLKTIYARLTFRGEPSPECWVFSSVYNREFNYNSRYLFEYVKENCPEIRAYFIMEDPEKRKQLQEEYGEDSIIDTSSIHGIKKVLSCKVWFTSTAPPLYGIGFGKKYMIFNLWHGVPLKKIGMEQKNFSKIAKRCYKYFFSDNYRGVLTTSSQLVSVMSKSFLVETKKIKVWGQPRNDMLFIKQDKKSVLSEVYGEKLPEFEKVLLYAPTFRDQGGTQLFPFADFERDRLLRWLEEQKILLCVRFHLYEEKTYRWLEELDVPGSRIRMLNEDKAADIMKILNVFDLLVTDYSSIYIDYLLTGNPIVFLPYDKEEYLDQRGLNFDYDQVTPGPKPKCFKEFLNSIYELLYNQNSYEKKQIEVNSFFNEIQSPCCEDICKNVKMLLDEEK